MKVYTVFSGSYSDRGMVGVFSTREKAQAFIDREGVVDREIDSTPIEIELDEKIPRECVEVQIYSDGDAYIYNDTYGNVPVEYDDIGVAVVCGYTYVRVAYNPDAAYIIKAARDKLAMWKAREAGI